MQLKIFIFSTIFAIISCQNLLPVLLWHSAGESCCGSEFETYSNLIKAHLGNDVYIKAVQVGRSASTDRVRSLTMHPFEQITIACDMIKHEEKFAHGYNAIGFSQGAVFLRGLAQKCPQPKMKNLISLGGPHQGFFSYPRCGEVYEGKCVSIQRYLTSLAYLIYSQKSFTPATYWHDLNKTRYKQRSTFLAIINNENEINQDFVNNLKSLDKFILVKYAEDIGVVPNESTWFGYFDENKVPHPLEDLEIYKQDRLGLKWMKENGKLIFITSPLGHLRLDESWFIKIIIPYLR